MIHIKVIKASYFKRILAVAAVILVIAFSIKYLQSDKSVHVLDSSENIDRKESIKEMFLEYNIKPNDIYAVIMEKAMPMLDACDNDRSDNTSQFIAFTLFKYISNIDISNPKTYLASEIPLLSLVDIVSFSGSVGGSSGKVADNKNGEQGKTDDPSLENEGNFEEMPVVNPNIDYSKPAVIIFHTHTSESFKPSQKYNYVPEEEYETLDKNYNVCRVGEEIKNYIETYYGVAVIHDTTVHDQPGRTGSYERAKPTIESLLKKYPDVKLIIDLHRDGVKEDQKDVVTAEIRGEQSAKVLFVVGKSNPHWQENYLLASKLSQKMEDLYPGLVRKVLVSQNIIYNQDISNRMILMEIGAQVNTLEEALVTSKMVARSIGEMLKDSP